MTNKGAAYCATQRDDCNAKWCGHSPEIPHPAVLPAQRLESIAPSMSKKGRLQVGADADISIFDPASIIDTASFESGLDFSHGVRHVFVNGVAVLVDGEIRDDVFPGHPVLAE